MRRNRKADIAIQRQDSWIGANARIDGDLVFAGSLRIDGHVAGNVSAIDDQSHSVTVTRGGCVEGRIDAPGVVVEGTVDGNLVSRRSAELKSSAHVSGDVHYRALTMDEGAVVNGSLICETAGARPPARAR